MNHQFIPNRKGQRIAVITEAVDHSRGLVFVMHGLGGFKEQPHIETMAQAFREKGFSVVRFDATNSFGESDGNYEDATTTNYYQDLEDVLMWSKKQTWFQMPFILVGHSLGAMSVMLYAEKFPEQVQALAPISAVASGELSFEAHSPEMLAEWERTGWRITESVSRPGTVKKLKWSHMEDRLKYSVLEKIDQLTMPVLLIVGEFDSSTPLEHQELIYDALPGEKELHIIEDAEHTFREPKHLAELKRIFSAWIDFIAPA